MAQLLFHRTVETLCWGVVTTELIDMMEMGCSLGPIDVWVEAIDRTPAARIKA